MGMQKYQCHKVVEAGKIDSIDHGVYESLLMVGGMLVYRLATWMARFKPEVGGYLVTYDDGYTSYSPAAAFEAGYTLIENPQ